MRNIVVRVLGAGVAGAVAWWAGFNLAFVQAQGILADPALQSPKMMQIFELSPPPRMATDPWLLYAAFLVVALIQAMVFAFIRRGLPAGLLARGVAFGIVAWALFTPWFEFYIPWNLMLEPTPLVLVEFLCWLVIMVLVGIAISLAFGRDPAESRSTASR